MHRHNEIGNSDVPWDEFFGALRDAAFDGVATVCVFGCNEWADEIHRRRLERVQAELMPAPEPNWPSDSLSD